MTDFDAQIKQLDEDYQTIQQKIAKANEDIEVSKKSKVDLQQKFEKLVQTFEPLNQKYNEEQKKERLNSNGIMMTSSLRVHVVKGDKFVTQDSIGSGDPYVQVEFEGQKEKTAVVSNLQFNEQFSMNVSDPKSILYLKSMDKNRFGSDDLTGESQIKLDEFRDQEVHEKWFQLLLEYKDQGRILAKIQFIWSHAAKTKEALDKVTKEKNLAQRELDQNKKEYEDLEAQIKTLNEDKEENRRKIQEIQFKKQKAQQEASKQPSQAKTSEPITIQQTKNLENASEFTKKPSDTQSSRESKVCNCIIS